MIRAIVSIALMLYAGWFAIHNLDDPVLRIPIAMYGVGAVLFVFFGIRKLRGFEPPTPQGDAVTVCLGLPSSPPQLKNFYRTLPDYCRYMLLDN